MNIAVHENVMAAVRAGARLTLALVVGTLLACESRTENRSDAAPISGAIEAVCAKATSEACPDGAPGAGCEQQLTADAKTAGDAGCSAAWQSLLDCWSKHPETCGLVPTQCNEQWGALLACKHRDAAICQVDDSLAPQKCSMQCTNFAVSCDLIGDSLSCRCTQGSHTGTDFTAPDCASVATKALTFCS